MARLAPGEGRACQDGREFASRTSTLAELAVNA
jgi:hypothetical protein